MSATVHRFPTPGGEEKKPFFVAPATVLETFDPVRTSELLEVARNALAGAETLLDFVHENRDLARHSGIETIAIELVAIMQGDRFSRVIDALEESSRQGMPVQLTPEGLSTLRRMESLLAESSANVRKFTEGDFTAMEIVEARARREADYHQAYLDLEEKRMDGIRQELAAKQASARRQADKIATLKAALGQSRSSTTPSAPASSRSSDFPLWLPLAIFGAVAVTVTIIAVLADRKNSSPG